MESPPPSNTTYNMAIIAVPRYPPADELDDILKAQLIFDYFVEEGKEHLSARNYYNLLAKVRGGQSDVVRPTNECESPRNILNC